MGAPGARQRCARATNETALAAACRYAENPTMGSKPLYRKICERAGGACHARSRACPAAVPGLSPARFCPESKPAGQRNAPSGREVRKMLAAIKEGKDLQNAIDEVRACGGTGCVARAPHVAGAQVCGRSLAAAKPTSAADAGLKALFFVRVWSPGPAVLARIQTGQRSRTATGGGSEERGVCRAFTAHKCRRRRCSRCCSRCCHWPWPGSPGRRPTPRSR